MPTDRLNTRTVTIASGASLSNALNDLDGQILVGIVMPADWTAANLTVQLSHDDSTFNNQYDEAGTEVTIVAAANRYINLTPANHLGATALKIRSGTSGTAVNQAADRIITLVLWAE
jgi:hypothetical protein